MTKETILITAALPYTNNVPHLGNMVGSHLPADIFARFCRLQGHEVAFIGGTDENGTTSEIAAQKYNITPKQLCDHFYKIHKQIYDWFEISYDNFSRTSRPIHHKTSNEFLQKVYKKGYIIKKTIKQPYCNSCKRGLADRYITGICPECEYENARGDQCEKCGTLLEPEKLVKPKCSVCSSKKIIFKDVEHLFLDLKKLSPKIEKWIKSNKQLRSQVRNLAMAWIKTGLKERCITRDLKWGIKVPIKGFEHFIWYVWAEAPIGYVSSTREWNEKKWKKFWREDSKIYNFIGKDNIPFHTISWPGSIIANGDYNLPYNVVGLQYLNYEKGKFSKSQNRGVFCENLPSAGLDPDYWRFYLTHVIPETRDTEFLWREFQEKINKELLGNLGNFVNRTLTFINKNYNGKVPEANLLTKDKAFIKQIEKETKEIVKLYEKVELRSALDKIMHLSATGNKYFQDNEPWKDPKKAKTTLYICANLCKDLALLMQPIIPNSSKKLLELLNCKEESYAKLSKFTIKPNQSIKKPQYLFSKIEDDKIKELKEKTSKVTEYFKEEEEMVSFEEWQKLKLKVGTVIEAEKHPNADKLYVLQVDIGDKTIQIVSGLKDYYELEDLKGKQIVVFTNLKPTKFRGIESNGMLLAAEHEDKVVLLEPDKKIQEGAEVC